jgi:hypothetical protein
LAAGSQANQIALQAAGLSFIRGSMVTVSTLLPSNAAPAGDGFREPEFSKERLATV